jgi:hypothetical protein
MTMTTEQCAIACKSCGHIFDERTLKIIQDTQYTIVPIQDRGFRNCLACCALQNVPADIRAGWPDR